MADDVGKLAASLGLDATEFKSGITTINREMRVLKSEFQATHATMGPLAYSMDGLKAKSDNLTRQIDLQRQKVAKLAELHRKAVEDKNADAKAVAGLEIKLNKATAELGKMENSLRRTSEDMRKLEAEATKATFNFEKLGSSMQKVGQGMSKTGSTLSTFITAPIVAAGFASVNMASDVQESMNKVDVAFKNSSGTVKDFAKTTLDNFGIAEGSALDMASLFGDMATSMGISIGQASEMSKKLVGLAGDLSSFKNIRLDVANTALKSIFTGETESLKELGIVMTQANLEAFALSKGITKNIQDMSEAEKVNLRYAFVLEKTKNAQGDFARTGGGAANQMRIFQESLKEVSASFGEVLLPEFTKLITKANQGIKDIGKFDEGTKKMIITIAGVAAVAGPTAVGLGKIVTAIGAIIKILPALNAGFAALIANPVVLGLMAVAASIGGIAAAAKYSQKELDATMEKIKQVAEEEARVKRESIESAYNTRIENLNKELSAEELASRERVSLQEDEVNAKIEAARESEAVQRKSLQEQQSALESSHKETIDRIRAEYGVVEETEKSKTDIVKEEAKKRISAIDQEIKAAEDTYNKNIDLIRNEYGVVEEVTKSKIDLLEEQADEEIQLAERVYKEKMELLDKEYKEKLKTLDADTRVQIEELQKEIDAIDKQTKEENRIREEQRNKEKILDYKRKIQKEEDAEDRRKLEEELAEFIEEINREKILDQRELEKQKLKEKIDDIKQKSEEAKETLKTEYEQSKSDLEQSLENEKILIEKRKQVAIAAIQEERRQKELEEKLKYEATKKRLEDEKKEIQIKADEEIEKIQNERREKEEAENAKYEATKKRLEDEEASLDGFAERVKIQLEAELQEKQIIEQEKLQATQNRINAEIEAINKLKKAEIDRIEETKKARINASEEEASDALYDERGYRGRYLWDQTNWEEAANFILPGKPFDGVPGRAIGDSNWRGGLVRVHEKGGEILRLPQGTEIIPHDVSMVLAKAAGQSSKAVNNTFTINQYINNETNAKLASRELYNLQKAAERGGGIG